MMRRTACLSLLALTVLLVLPGCGSLRRRMAARAAKRPPYARVTPPVAFEIMHDSPAILILDLRSPQAYNGDTGHLFRAHNIPLERLPYRLLEISPFRDDTFLVYCDTSACADEGMAVLVSSGFEDAVLIDGGIDGWIKTSFPTVLPSDIAGRAAERAAGVRGAGVQPPPGTPADTAVESVTAPPPPPPPR
jgi:rhodanese-related sulfurtransferase